MNESEIKQESTYKSAGKIGLLTLISRILGLFRDIAMTAVFGTGMAADAFLLAFRIPNILRKLFAEGSLTSAVIPIFTEKINSESTEVRASFIKKLFGLIGLVLGILVLAGVIFAPLLTYIFAPAWKSDPEKFALTINLTRWLFPYVLVVAFAAIVMSILHSHRRFVPPALGPIVQNIIWITAVVIALAITKDVIIRIYIVVGGVLLGGTSQLLVQIPAFRARGYHFKFQLDTNDESLRQVVTLLTPGVLGLVIYELNIVVDSALASLLEEGSVSALTYGNHIVFVPLAIFGTSVATAILPRLSLFAAEKNFSQVQVEINRAIRIAIFLLVPATLFLIVFSTPTIQVLYQRGAFNAEKSTPFTVAALIYYSYGLIGYAGVKIFSQLHYAFKDTKTPMKIAFYALIVNVFFNLILIGPMGLAGIALATSIGAFFNMALLMIYAHRYFNLKDTTLELTKFLISTLLISSASVFIFWKAFNFVAMKFEGSFMLKLGMLFGCGVGMYLVVLGVGKLMRIPEADKILRIRR